MIRHLPLARRKALCGRIALAQAAEPIRRSLHRIADGRQLEEFQGLLGTLADQALNPALKDEPPDVYLQTFAAEVRQAAAKYAGTSGARYRQLAAGIEQHAAAVCCHSCSYLAPTICDATNVHQDDEIVHRGGHCLHPIKAMCRAAEEVASAYYRHYVPHLRAAPAPDIVLATAFETRKPHRLPVEIHVTGMLMPRTPAHAAVLTIVVHVERFEGTSLLAIPYVAFHELVCHAYQGIAVPGATLRDIDEDNPFTEGWMDWLAGEMLEEVMNGKGPAAALAEQFAAWPDHLDAGLALHKARFRPSPEAPGQEIPRDFGRRAARGLQDLLRAASVPESAIWETQLEISLNVLAHAPSDVILEHFVIAVHRHIAARTNGEPSTLYDNFLTKYLKDKDAGRLLDDYASSSYDSNEE